MSPPLSTEDLDHVVSRVGNMWEMLEGKRVLFTGASGFFGSWMLETFLHSGSQLRLPFRALAVTRNASRFLENLPHLAGDPRVDILESDVAAMPLPEGPVDYVVHSLVPDAETPISEMDTFFQSATARLLDVAVEKSAHAFLLCSTGAVYQPKAPMSPLSEDDPLVPRDGAPSYGQIRRKVEDQCLLKWIERDLPVKIGRGFTFVGPRLPLDGSFAIGNFLRDALADGPIVVRGDGTPVRSYLYASDMTAQLWTVLLKGLPGLAFNIGSPEPVTIADLARIIGMLFSVNVRIECGSIPGTAPSCYIPDISRAEFELGRSREISMEDGIKKMARWHSSPSFGNLS